MLVPPPGEKPRTPLNAMGASTRGSMLAAAAAAAEAETEEEEQDPLADWTTLLVHLRPLMDFIDKCVDAKRKLLLHCDTGISTSFCVLLVYMLTKRRVRLSAAIEHVQKIRKQCALTENTEDNTFKSLMAAANIWIGDTGTSFHVRGKKAKPERLSENPAPPFWLKPKLLRSLILVP